MPHYGWAWESWDRPWTVVADKFRSCCNGDTIGLLLGVTSHKPDKKLSQIPIPCEVFGQTQPLN